MSKNVLVTGIGGNVAQGILRNIIALKYGIRLVGIDTKNVSAGNHLCDKTYQVSHSSSPDYIPEIVKICQMEKIDLIIPGTDYETYYLAMARKKLPTLASSDTKVAHTFLNKYETYLAFSKLSIPFAETMLPSKYKNEFDEIIVKPTEGVGSKGIYINPPNPDSFSGNYIIQKLYKGTEITIAFYITKDKKLLGQITFIRTLVHGATNICEVTFKYSEKVEILLKKIVENFDIKGSCNVQAVVESSGDIIPFELNCRISGTNSIRSQFGFEDVKYVLEEYLFNITPKKPTIKNGSAVRILMDVIYPGIGIDQIKDKSTKHYIF